MLQCHFERALGSIDCNQLLGESVKQYITLLYTVIETCEYGNLREDSIGDQGHCLVRMSAVRFRYNFGESQKVS